MNRPYCFVLTAVFSALFFASASADERPNVLWIYVDDMSDWIGCYGYELAESPNIDQLALEGTRFENAFMPAPVCSATRSALITGTMQTSHGLHHHRTMVKKPLPESISTIPELFRAAGYVTFNEQKEDYNFTRDRDRLYSRDFKRPKMKGHLVGRDVSWLKQLQGKKFFGQIQLKGGKFGGETGSKFPAESRLDPSKVTVPPYYPDDPVIRNAIARHYEQVAETDEQVGAIIAALKEYGLYENTVIFFFTDHGVPLPRAKQFIYEDGAKVPLIVSGPKIARGKVRDDLVNGIDISAATLSVAGIEIPDTVEGKDFLSDNYQKQKYIIAARDRCGIAVDRIRAVRSQKFRYVQNFQTDRPLYQPQYRDKFASIMRLRELFAEGKLTPVQASYHSHAARPKEELYELESDPHQVNNLAKNPKFASVMTEHRDALTSWIKATDDKGQYPASEAELKAVFDYAKGKVASPEFDFLKLAEEK
ncbi:sulfatase [Verrucomicrobiales bacterium]|nr:sulfatase [Verrucomicrobiales bacterium]MDC0322654.1 sulfatase [Verrucomicrobiales bacterium]